MKSQEPKLEKEIKGHYSSVFTVCFSPNEKLLCSAGNDKKVILTNLEKSTNNNNDLNNIELLGHSERVNYSCFSSDGNLLGTSSRDGSIRIWDTSNLEGQCVSKRILKPQRRAGRYYHGGLDCVNFFQYDASIVAAFESGIRVWDIETKRQISELSCGGSVISVDVHHGDNRTIACGEGFRGYELRIFDYSRSGGNCVKNFKPLAKRQYTSINSVQFHPICPFSLAFATSEGGIGIIDTRTFQLLQIFERAHSKSIINSISFHPSGKFIISGSGDGSVKILSLDQEKMKVLYTFEEHKMDYGLNTVYSVQFSPKEGKYFASGSDNQNVFVYRFPPWIDEQNQKMMIEDEKRRVDFLLMRKDNISVFEERRFVCKIILLDMETLFSYKFLLSL